MTKTSNDRYKEGYQHWDMVSLGWKYNLSNIQAAMLLPQLARINENLEKRRLLFETYCENLSDISSVETFTVKDGTKHAYHLFVIRIKNNFRDEVIQNLLDEGIEVVVNYRAIHMLSYFRNSFGYKAGDFPIAEGIGDEVISLPFYPCLELEKAQIVCQVLSKTLKGLNK